jgi:SAM-dependent methyltransferase
MSDISTGQTWADGGAYEDYIGRWSRVIAPQVVAWMDVPPGAAWLDAGCGTGALTQAMLDAGAGSVVGVDRSEGFLAFAREAVRDPRARFELGDLVQLPLPSHSVDAVGSGLVLNFVPDPAAAMAQLVRVLRPGGVAACYLWDYAGGMELIRTFWDAAIALDPSAAVFDEGRRFAGICAPRPLAALFDGAGMVGVESRTVEAVAHFAGVEAAWRPFLGGQGPAPAYLLSLNDDAQQQVYAEFARRLATGADGSVEVVLQAIAVKGRAPA